MTPPTDSTISSPSYRCRTCGETFADGHVRDKHKRTHREKAVYKYKDSSEAQVQLDSDGMGSQTGKRRIA